MTPSILVSPFGLALDALPAGTHFFGTAVKLEPLSDAYKARLIEYLDRVGEDNLSKHARKRPIFNIPIKDVAAIKAAGTPIDQSDYALNIHRFAMDYFSNVHTPMASFYFDGEHVQSHSVDFRDLLFRDGQELELPPGAWEKGSAYLNFAYGALDRAPLARLAITRTCRAARQGPNGDGIIDLAIALESLLSANTEIKFQFSLFHALLRTDALADREDAFALLRDLYDCRSLFAHGGVAGKSSKTKIKNVTARWGDLIGIARDNLTYYLAYCTVNKHAEWDAHVNRLAMGAPRIVIGAAA